MVIAALRTRNRPSGWTAERQAAFLVALGESGSAERAAVAVGLSVSTAYRLRKQARGADFAAGWDAVLSVRIDRLKEELLARANPAPRPVYYRGRVVGEKVAVSNRLLLSVLTRTIRNHRVSSVDAATAHFAALERLAALKVNDSTDSATIP